jgi:hypothetical protein
MENKSRRYYVTALEYFTMNEFMHYACCPLPNINFPKLCDASYVLGKKSKITSIFNCIGCSLKFILTVAVEESIVNAPLVSLQRKNTNNAKNEVRFQQLIRDRDL